MHPFPSPPFPLPSLSLFSSPSLSPPSYFPKACDWPYSCCTRCVLGCAWNFQGRLTLLANEPSAIANLSLLVTHELVQSYGWSNPPHLHLSPFIEQAWIENNTVSPSHPFVDRSVGPGLVSIALARHLDFQAIVD